MVKNIIHKVSAGKLIRLRLRIDKGMIKEIRITGDFFVYPETDIFEIEKELLGKEVGEAGKVLDGFMKKRGTIIVGFGSADLAEAINKFDH